MIAERIGHQMIRAAVVCSLALASTAVFAQSGGTVKQNGAITPGHAASWTSNGTIQDAGSATDGLLTELGITKNGGCALGINTGPLSGPFNQMCAGVDSLGGYLNVQNFGGESTPSFRFIINGVTFPLSGSGSLNVLTQGVTTDGTDTTATLHAALVLAASLGQAAYMPCGTYTVDGLVIPGGLSIVTDGPCTALRRRNSAASGFIASMAGAGNYIGPAITLDGNATSNTVLANNLFISGASNFVLNGVTSINALDAGIFIAGTGDKANHTASIISNFNVSNNGFAGIVEQPSGASTTPTGTIWYLTRLNGTAYNNGSSIAGGGGMVANNFQFPFTSAFKDTISHNTDINLLALGNTGSGIGWSGFVQAGATGFTTMVPGPGNDPVSHLTASHLTAILNTGYGIAAQVDQSSFSDINTFGNGSAGTGFFAGLLANSENTDFKGAHTNEVGLQYGADAGGCYHCQLTDFQAIGSIYGVNLEADQYTTLDGADCPSFGNSSSGICVRIARVGGTGTTTATGANIFFPFDGNHIYVDHTKCILANIFQTCVAVLADPQFISVRDSRSSYLASANIASDNSNVYTFQCTTGCDFSNNKTDFSDPYFASQAVAGGTSLILNDWLEDVNINFTPNAGPITGIYNTFVSSFLSSAYRATVTAGGSNYGNPIATAAGGGCSVEPTISLGVRPDTNAVVNASVTAPGSGCSGVPTVTVTDSNGSGSGATVTVSIQPWGAINGRTIHVRASSATLLSFTPGSRIFTPNNTQYYLPNRSDAYFWGFNAGGNYEWHLSVPSLETANAWTASGCSNSAIAGVTKADGSMSGQFVSGTTGTCSVTLTAGAGMAAPHGYQCNVFDVATGAAFTLSSSTTTTAAITGTTTSGNTVAVNCASY